MIDIKKKKIINVNQEKIKEDQKNLIKKKFSFEKYFETHQRLLDYLNATE